VPYTLKKRESVLKAVHWRAFARKKEKFGLEVPAPGAGGVKRAFEVDAESGTTHWGVAMEKTVLPALRILELGEVVPPGYTRIDLMTVFDVKMDLTCKARICARGDQTEPPVSFTYASVVTRESIRLDILSADMASLNHLDILSADIAGAYFIVKCAEKIYTVLGSEFGDLEGRTAIVEKALYGLCSSGYAWRSTLARTLPKKLELEQCCGDMEVWRKP